MKLKVGDYVRTKDGIIAKCVEEKIDRYIFDRIVREECYYNDYIWKDISEKANHIKKYSPNLIDLIEENDYVNGSKVVEVGKDYVSVEFSILGKDELMLALIYTEDLIKSVVTKEQFERVSFKVGD